MAQQCSAHHPSLPRVCVLPEGHGGDHMTQVQWPVDGAVAADEAPTVQFPPIGETVRRRPPVPPARVVELTDRVELLQALGRELQRELAVLRDVDEDQADEPDPALELCECGHARRNHGETGPRVCGFYGAGCECSGFVAL